MGGCLVVYLTTVQDSSKSRKFASEIERYNGTSNRIAKLQLDVICPWNSQKKKIVFCNKFARRWRWNSQRRKFVQSNPEKDDGSWGLEIAKSMYVSMCRKAICAT